MDARDIITKDMTVGDLKKIKRIGTYKFLQSKDLKVKIRIVKDPYTDEYVGKWYEDGKYNESKTAYESTKQDAVDTAKAAIKHYNKYKK